MLTGSLTKETAGVSRFTIDLTIAQALFPTLYVGEAGSAQWLGSESVSTFMTPTVKLGAQTSTSPIPQVLPQDPSPLTVQSCIVTNNSTALQLFLASGTPGNQYTVQVILMDTAGRELPVEVLVTISGVAPPAPLGLPLAPSALPLSGGTMTGPLYLSESPQSGTEAATKSYVDSKTGGGSQITTPSITIDPTPISPAMAQSNGYMLDAQLTFNLTSAASGSYASFRQTTTLTGGPLTAASVYGAVDTLNVETGSASSEGAVSRLVQVIRPSSYPAPSQTMYGLQIVASDQTADQSSLAGGVVAQQILLECNGVDDNSNRNALNIELLHGNGTGSGGVSPQAAAAILVTAGGDAAANFLSTINLSAPFYNAALDLRSATTVAGGTSNAIWLPSGLYISFDASNVATLKSDGSTLISSAPVRLPSYTQSGLPSLSSGEAGAVAYVSNGLSADGGSGGALAFVNGSGIWETIFGALRGFIGGLIMSNDSTSPNTVLDIAQGLCADSTGSVPIALGAFTKSISGSWVAGSGNNGMGQGLTATLNTWYHVFAVIVNGVSDVYFDTSVTAANAPSGTTAFRRIGSIVLDGSVHIETFVQLGDTVLWATPHLAFSAFAPTQTPVLKLVGSPVGVQCDAMLYVSFTNTAGTVGLLISSPDQASVNGSGLSWANVVNDVQSAYNDEQLTVRTDTSAQVRVVGEANSANLLTVYTYGYVDTRGRFA